MSPIAITMMIIAIAIIGGGLVVSASVLMTHPDEPDDD
ncbi:MAG TPA: methionine/alanine import family NSS transporter small subunit [Glycomyces sp.]